MDKFWTYFGYTVASLGMYFCHKAYGAVAPYYYTVFVFAWFALIVGLCSIKPMVEVSCAALTAAYSQMGLGAFVWFFSDTPVGVFAIPSILFGVLWLVYVQSRMPTEVYGDQKVAEAPDNRVNRSIPQQVQRTQDERPASNNTSSENGNRERALRNDAPASPAVTHRVRQPKQNFTRLAGMQATKEELLKKGQSIVNGEQRNGILLFGEPGNGKTVFAEALAAELRIGFLSVSFADLNSMWIG